MINNDFRDIMFNRRSIKVFDENVKISHEEMMTMLNETVTAPSSINMQPWRFAVVESEEGKNILRPLMKFNTRQNDTSSAMVVIFGDMKCYEKLDDIYSRAVEKAYMAEEMKKERVEAFVPHYQNLPKPKMQGMLTINASLVAMQLMLVARAHGYDTNPIGGFEKEKVAAALGYDEERYFPVLIVAIGKANYEPHGTVRLKAEEITDFK